MKKLALILGLALGLTNPAKADIWTLVDLTIVDDFRSVLDTAVFRNLEDCRTAALIRFVKKTGIEKGIRVHENTLDDTYYIKAVLTKGSGTFSGDSTMYYIACNHSSSIK